MTQDQPTKRLTDKDYNDLNNIGESDMIQVQIGDYLSSKYHLTSWQISEIDSESGRVIMTDSNLGDSLSSKITDLLWSYKIGLLEITRKSPRHLSVHEIYTREMTGDKKVQIGDWTLDRLKVKYTGQLAIHLPLEDKISLRGQLEDRQSKSLESLQSWLYFGSSLKKTRILKLRESDLYKSDQLSKSLDLYVLDLEDQKIDSLEESKSWSSLKDQISDLQLDERVRSADNNLLWGLSQEIRRGLRKLKYMSLSLSKDPEDFRTLSDYLLGLRVLSNLTQTQNIFDYHIWQILDVNLQIIRSPDILSDSLTLSSLVSVFRAGLQSYNDLLDSETVNLDSETVSKIEMLSSLCYLTHNIVSDRLEEIRLRDLTKSKETDFYIALLRVRDSLMTLYIGLLESKVLEETDSDILTDLDYLSEIIRRQTGSPSPAGSIPIDPSPEDLESLGLFDPEEIQKEIDSESGPEETRDSNLLDLEVNDKVYPSQYDDPVSDLDFGDSEDLETAIFDSKSESDYLDSLSFDSFVASRKTGDSESEVRPDSKIEVNISDSGQLMPDLRLFTPEERELYLEIFSGLDSETDSESE